jgi:hypothetical protein
MIFDHSVNTDRPHCSKVSGFSLAHIFEGFVTLAVTFQQAVVVIAIAMSASFSTFCAV